MRRLFSAFALLSALNCARRPANGETTAPSVPRHSANGSDVSEPESIDTGSVVPQPNRTSAAGGEQALPDGMSLPILNRGTDVTGDGLHVYVSPSGLYLGRERHLVATLDERASLEGYSPSNKKHPNDLLVLPLLESLQLRREPPDGDVLIFADKQTPYRVLVETLYSLEQGSYGHFFLMVQIEQSLYPVQEPAKFVGLKTSPLSFEWVTPVEVFVVNYGYALRINDQRVGAKCGAGPREGMAVPRIGNQLDPLGLASCLRRWLPSATKPRASIIGNPGTPLSDMLTTAEVVVTAGATFEFRAPR